jgi:hypothetical protein
MLLNEAKREKRLCDDFAGRKPALLQPHSRTALKERRADQSTDAEPFGDAWSGGDFVFTTK